MSTAQAVGGSIRQRSVTDIRTGPATSDDDQLFRSLHFRLWWSPIFVANVVVFEWASSTLLQRATWVDLYFYRLTLFYDLAYLISSASGVLIIIWNFLLTLGPVGASYWNNLIRYDAPYLIVFLPIAAVPSSNIRNSSIEPCICQVHSNRFFPVRVGRQTRSTFGFRLSTVIFVWPQSFRWASSGPFH